MGKTMTKSMTGLWVGLLIASLFGCLLFIPAGLAEAKVTKPKIAISTATLTLSKDSYVYDGKAKKPNVTVKRSGKKLKTSTDYSVSYKNNIKAGTATVTVKGKKSYTGTKSKTFKITKASLAKATVKLSTSAYTYDGKAKKPTATVTLSGKRLSKTTHYTVTYASNVNAGTATVSIKGTGNYTGAVSKKFTIGRCSLAKATLSISPSALPYNRTAQKPAVAAKVSGRTLKAGSDFTVAYRHNVAMGTATATITGIGNYTATASKNFSITEPILRPWIGSASSTSGVANLTTIPVSQRNVAKFSFTGYSDKSAELVIDGITSQARWKLDTGATSDNRYYTLTLDSGAKWGMFYNQGKLTLVNLSNSNHLYEFV